MRGTVNKLLSNARLEVLQWVIMNTVVSSVLMSHNVVDIYRSFVGTCTIQLRDIKEVAQERGTAKPQTWGGGLALHRQDQGYYGGMGFCNTKWNHTEEDNNLLQVSSKQSFYGRIFTALFWHYISSESIFFFNGIEIFLVFY